LSLDGNRTSKQYGVDYCTIDATPVDRFAFEGKLVAGGGLEPPT
jgi:hypothetical protein